LLLNFHIVSIQHGKGKIMTKMIRSSIQANPLCKPLAGAKLSGRAAGLMLAVVLVGSLAACSKPAPKVEEVRPVRVMRTAAKPIDTVAEFSGEVRPRIESRLGFRVGGKIIARKVDVGATVKRGQVLMQLDPQDLQLAQAQASAGLKAAESNYQLAKAELSRYQDLREKNFVSQAVLDSKNTAYLAARASYDQAVATYRNQSNMAGYATLVADADGVVAGIDAEVGQVVAPGMPVLRLAQAGEKEIVIGIPEDKVDTLRRVSDVKVHIWAMPDAVFAGKIREIAPMADPATRTYTARIAIPDAPAGVKLGMTAYVTFASASPQAMLRLPMTAIFQHKSGSAVWAVENGAVKLVPVQLAGPAGNDLLIAGGLTPGQTVVTAGVNLLKPGQKVKILNEEGTGTTVASASANAGGAAK
jgi:RND family efflux transporter MFP subunit